MQTFANDALADGIQFFRAVAACCEI